MHTNLHELSPDQHDLLYKEDVYAIVGRAMEVHSELGGGFLEKVYKNALACELANHKIDFVQQPEITVTYKGQKIGCYIPDFVIENKIIIELKTIDKIGSNEMAQVLNYLKATDIKLGLIINFKNQKLEWRRVVR